MKQVDTNWVEVCSIQDIPVRGAIKVEHGSHLDMLYHMMT